MKRRTFVRGESVIYRKPKHTSRPGPRAHDVDPEPRGERYRYEVDKLWVVVKQQDDTVLLATRRGKRHVVPIDDRRLRRPYFWERVFYRSRFPCLDELDIDGLS
jgi:hypothetical protein